MTTRGTFITFEGIDGAGKSTHIAALAAALQAAGRTVVQTREPGGSVLAEKLRQLVLHDAMDGLTEALLVFAARRDHWLQTIAPALQAGHTVLCDRFTDSTFAYQGAGRGLDWDQLQTLERLALQGGSGSVSATPDHTFWFYLPPAQAAARLAAARSPDRFEALAGQGEFFEKVSSGYQRRLDAAPQRFAKIDSAVAPEAVWQQVQAAARGWGLLAHGTVRHNNFAPTSANSAATLDDATCALGLGGESSCDCGGGSDGGGGGE